MNIKEMTNAELISYRDDIVEFFNIDNPEDSKALKEAHAELLSRLEAGEKAMKRYELVRKLSPEQFKDIILLNLRTGKPFDEIVKEMNSEHSDVDELIKKYNEALDTIRHWEGSRDGVMQAFDEMNYEMENLKCCGNCQFINLRAYCYHYDYDILNDGSRYCDKWQSDNLTREQRSLK